MTDAGFSILNKRQEWMVRQRGGISAVERKSGGCRAGRGVMQAATTWHACGR